ncbi:hypothetical protein Tco_0540857 [Tanacetum coccineum]
MKLDRMDPKESEVSAFIYDESLESTDILFKDQVLYCIMGYLEMVVHAPAIPTIKRSKQLQMTILLCSSCFLCDCIFGIGVSGFGMGEVVLSTFKELQMLGFFLQMGFTFILATLDGLDVGLLGDVIGEDDCDEDE